MSPGVSSSADRTVSLGAFALWPVTYVGHDGLTPKAPAVESIAGLTVSALGVRRAPPFHPGNGLYGFTDLPAGTYRVHVVDPARRYLPFALTAAAPDRSALRLALARGAVDVPIAPAVADPPFLPVPLRRAPGSPIATAEAALFGVVRARDGAPLPFARVEVVTPQGRYLTYTDTRGEYLAPLSFLRAVAGTVAASGEEPEVQDTFDVQIQVHRLRAALPGSGDPLAIFPAGFDALVPGVPPFDNFYDAIEHSRDTSSLKVGTTTRLDPTPR